MPSCFATKATKDTCPVLLVTDKSLKTWLKKQDAATKTWVKASGFEASAGELLPITSKSGKLKRVLFGVPKELELYSTAPLPAQLKKLSAKTFRIEGTLTKKDAYKVTLGWALGSYQFTAYKKGKGSEFPKLVWPQNAERKVVQHSASAVFYARDLINTPANSLGPEELAGEARKLARRYGGTCTVTTGKALLGKNFPAIYEVGKGSDRQPRLIDIKWGSPRHPKLTLIGKGVCFDTGGYSLKSNSNMVTMKKDMAGAAHVLALASMVMASKLKVRLRVLVPAVENSISGDALRPSDIINTRKGLTVEVGNTDAEGRLILCDALAEACREKPKLIVDFATLTGGVSMGPDVGAMFSNNDKIANDTLKASEDVQDPVWRLPLPAGYHDYMKSSVADTNNVTNIGRGGTIFAAIFLEKFVDPDVPWMHLDVVGLESGAKPGRPTGAQITGIRAVYNMLEKKFG